MRYILLLTLVVLAACSTKNDVAMNEAYQKYNSSAEWKRMDTIAAIAAQGDSGVVAAALLMQGGKATGAITAQPTSTGDKVLGAVAALSPTVIGLGQIAATVDGNRTNKDIAIIQSDNNKAVSIVQSDNDLKIATDTNATMSDLATVSIVKPEIQIVDPKVYCVFDGTSACQ
tara:strand:+ start:926 stop:1441 length:516 start_codon:yes stop_codon:yes gene_type:complete